MCQGRVSDATNLAKPDARRRKTRAQPVLKPDEWNAKTAEIHAPVGVKRELHRIGK